MCYAANHRCVLIISLFFTVFVRYCGIFRSRVRGILSRPVDNPFIFAKPLVLTTRVLLHSAVDTCYNYNNILTFCHGQFNVMWLIYKKAKWKASSHRALHVTKNLGKLSADSFSAFFMFINRNVCKRLWVIGGMRQMYSSKFAEFSPRNEGCLPRILQLSDMSQYSSFKLFPPEAYTKKKGRLTNQTFFLHFSEGGAL